MDLMQQDERTQTDSADMGTNGRLFEHGNEIPGTIICRDFLLI
jgi:hypothetical protein